MAGMFDDLVPAGEKPKAEKVDSGPWDSFKAQPGPSAADAASSGPWSKYQQGGAFDDLIPAEKPKSSLARRAIGDTAISAVKGAIGLTEVPVGIADLATGGRVGKALEGVGYRPAEAKSFLDEMYSPEQKAANAAVQNAEGFVGTTKAALQNPSTIGQAVVESAPLLLPGAAVARGLGAATKLSPAVAAGLSEGVVGAGLAAEQMRQNSDDGLLSGQQAAASLASGIGTAAFGVAGGKIAQSAIGRRLGMADVDTALAMTPAQRAAAGGANAGLAKRVAGGAVSEGVLEELPQSMWEQAAQNYGEGKDLGEGVAEAGAMGMLAGGVMGGGFNALQGPGRQEKKADDSKPDAPLALPAPTYTGTPGDQALAADVERENQVAAAQANADQVYAERDAFEQQRVPQKLPVTGPMSAAVNVGIDAGATSITSPANPRYDVPAQPRGSFSSQAELADLINQEQADLADRRELTQFIGQERSDQAQRISEAAGSRRAMDDALADVDQRVAGAATQEAEAARLRLLNNILSGISDTGNPARQFGNALRRAGYRDTGFTEREQQTIRRFTDARAALNSPEATTVPAAPNELDPAALGIRELADGQQQGSGAQRDKAAEVADLVSQGWRLSVGRTLVSPKGKRRNLNAAEFAAAKEARARINNAMEVGNAAATQMDAVRDQGRRDVGGRGAGSAQPVPGVEGGRGTDAGASASGMRAPGVVGNAAGTGGALNAAQPEQVAQETAQADGAQVAPAGGRVAARSQAPIMRRDDLIGAIMRVTGGAGIASNMAQTITGDKAGRGNPSLRGLFQNAGTMDLDDTADLLRTQEGYDIRDGNHLAELIREQGAGNRVVSMERAERDAADNAEKEYRAAVNEQAASMGLKRSGGKRTLQMVEADIARIEAEIEAKERELSEMEAREERAAIQAEAVYDEIYGADLSESDWMTWLSSRIAGAYTQEEIDNVERIQADREDARAAADADDFAGVEPQAGAGSRQGIGADEAQPGGTEERARGASEGFGLTQQTNKQAAEQFAQQQAGEDAGPTKAQADRERDAVPFSLGMQSQPRPQGLQAWLFTADGRVSVAATEESKAEAASAAVVRAKPVSQWSAEEIQARLDRGNLSQESEQKLRDLLASKQKAKPAPAKKKTAISVGHTPGNAQPVTIRNGIVFIGEEPAIDFETGDDVTVSEAATPQHIADALKKSGALGRRKIFGATAIPQMAKANFSESRAAMPADAEFQATERAYGGREAYGRAKADGRTKLNYRQWVQVRTPKFKEWFGDWEAANENESFNAILKQVENGAIKSGTIIQLGTAGSILNQFGIPSLKIEMTQSVLSQHMKKHGIGFDHLRDLAAHVQAPIAVFKSKRSADSVILLTEIQHPDGDLVVALQANKERNRLVINDIRSIHPKPSQKIDFWIDDGLLIGVDESRGRHLLSTTDRSNSGRGERQEASDVILFNTDALRNVSKAVDPETGEPLVMYHGTNEDFTIFDTTTSEFGSHFGTKEQADGFASKKGGRVMPAYLSIKNPLRLEDRGEFNITLVSEQLRELGVLSSANYSMVDEYLDALDPDMEIDVIAMMRRAIEAKGYDGIVYLNRREGFEPFGPDGVDGDTLNSMTDDEVLEMFPEAQDSWITLHPEQIKSATGNNGNFDGRNADIRESRADRSAIDTAMRRMDRFVAEFERGTMKDSDTQSLGDTPTVLQFLGADNLPLQIDGATVRKTMAGKHRYDVSPQALRNVVQALYDPLAVFRSATGTGLVVLSEVQSNNGNPVVAAIHLAKRKGGMIINDVASIHEKTDAEKSIGAWLRDDLLRYVRNENDLSGAATRHLLPASVATSIKGHMDNVATENDVVNEFGPRYSVASGAAAADNMPLNNRQKMVLNAVQRAADKFRAEYTGAAALDIRVVYSRDEIPTRYRPSPYAEGVYHDREGIIYLVASNLPTGQRAWQVLMHESVGHYGLANMMGDKFAGLQATVLKMATAGQAMDRDPQPGERGYETVEAVRRLYPEASDAEVAQEVLARMAETMPDVGWFRMALNRIAAWLKSAARAFGLASEPTMADVRRTVELAGYHVRSGANLGQDAGVRDVAFASQRAESRAAVIDRAGAVADRARDIGRRLAGKDAGETAAMFPDLDADQQAFLGKIGGGKTKAADAIRAAFDRAGLKIRQGLVDRYAALKELDEKAVGEDFINTAITDSSWVLAKMSSAGAGALNAMMTTGRIAFDAAQRVITLRGEPNGGLVDVLRQLGGPAEVERWFGWVAANRAEKLMAEGREHLFTADEIAAGKRMNLGKTDDGKARPMLYAKVFSEFNQFRDDVVAIAEQTGVLSAEERAMWKDEFYVPFYRVMQEEGDAKGPRASKGLSRQEAYKKLKGGRENLNDLMENTLMNFHHLLSASLKNQAATQAIRNAEKAGIARRVPESRRDTKTSTFILEGGDRVFYEVDDPMVYEAITSLSDPGLNNFAVRMMSAFKRVFTNMTTVTPQFVIANTFRDLLQAAATSPTSKNVFRTAMQGAASYRDQKTRAEMLAAGGAFSFGHIYGTDTDEIKASLRKNVAGANLISDASMVPEILRQGWKRWNEITDTSENITRAAAYVQNVEQLGKLRAAFEARDIMDFSQHGAWPAVRFMIRVVPFLNARLQGLDKLYRSGAKPMLLTAMGEGSASDKQAAARFASVTGALVLASLALYMANADDDEYQKLEEWQKDTYWFFRIGENAFFLPKPFEVGAISTMAERVAQQMMDDKATGKLFRERLGDMLMQTFAFNPTPQLFQPMIDVYSNKDAFTGRDIETMGMERLSKGLRARDTTTSAAQAVSSASRVFGDETPFAVSPVQADHLIRGYLGTVGAQAAGMIDTIWRTAAGQEAPSKAWSEYQPIKRFYRDLGVPSSHNRYSTLFYDGLREANRVYADVMELQKLGRQDDARELSAENRGLLSMRQALNRDQRSLSEINKRIQDARRSDMDGDQKRQEIDRLTVMKNAITDRSGRLVESIRAAE